MYEKNSMFSAFCFDADRALLNFDCRISLQHKVLIKCIMLCSF